MRALAETMKDSETIEIMLQLENGYDKLADRAVLRSNGEGLPPGGI